MTPWDASLVFGMAGSLGVAVLAALVAPLRVAEVWVAVVVVWLAAVAVWAVAEGIAG